MIGGGKLREVTYKKERKREREVVEGEREREVRKKKYREKKRDTKIREAPRSQIHREGVTEGKMFDWLR